jgi:hypothetical protein
MRTPQLVFDKEDNSFCCGIEHIGNLSVSDEGTDGNEYEIRPSLATMATTTRDMTGVIKRLKQLRFTKAYSFTNRHTGNRVTVWFKAPKK